MSPRSRIDLLLSAARARLHRLTPDEALARGRGTARCVVDIRPAAQRAEHGDLPGALVVERNVLEWRFDPTSEAALRIADDDLQVIVLCQEGYTSSLGGRRAAATSGCARRPTSSAGMPRGSPPWTRTGARVGRPSRAGRPGARFGSAASDPDPRVVALADDHFGDAVAHGEGVEVRSHRELARRGSRGPRGHGGR